MKTNLSESIDFIKTHISTAPNLGIILGSGLGSFADLLQNKIKIPTVNIPHYPPSTVEGHNGFLVFGEWENKPVVAVQGRTHFYEGYEIEKVTYVVRIMAKLGIKTLIVTNAAGGVNPRFKPGSLMLITDHINAMYQNPLIGSLKYGEPRFPDMSEPYTQKYFDLIEKISEKNEISIERGVLYVSSGPSYETAAEVKMIAKLGGDAASMSTVPEVIVANHSGLDVIGISCITNQATGIGKNPLNHDEVTRTAQQVHNKFIKLISGIIKEII